MVAGTPTLGIRTGQQALLGEGGQTHFREKQLHDGALERTLQGSNEPKFPPWRSHIYSVVCRPRVALSESGSRYNHLRTLASVISREDSLVAIGRSHPLLADLAILNSPKGGESLTRAIRSVV